jgi:4-alpha-glucanotransferase
MRRHGLPGMYVLEFELTEDGRRAATGSRGAGPEAGAGGALASIGTHDTPTFAGWWWGEDIRIRRELGHLSEEEADGRRGARAGELAGAGA